MEQIIPNYNPQVTQSVNQMPLHKKKSNTGLMMIVLLILFVLVIGLLGVIIFQQNSSIEDLNSRISNLSTELDETRYDTQDNLNLEAIEEEPIESEVMLVPNDEPWVEKDYSSNNVKMWTVSHPDSWQSEDAGLHAGSLTLGGEWRDMQYSTNFYFPLFNEELGVPPTLEEFARRELTIPAGANVSNSLKQISVEGVNVLYGFGVVPGISSDSFFAFFDSAVGRNYSVMRLDHESAGNLDKEQLGELGEMLAKGVRF